MVVAEMDDASRVRRLIMEQKQLVEFGLKLSYLHPAAASQTLFVFRKILSSPRGHIWIS